MNKPPVTLRAVALAGRWQRLAQGHVALRGGPCACILDTSGLSVADFEQDVVEFLRLRHGADARLARCFEQAGGARARLLPLLQAIARSPDPGPQADALLHSLETSLASFEGVH